MLSTTSRTKSLARRVDKSGNLWLFGGWGANWWVGGGGDQELNDLWVYSPSTNEWAWMGGNAATDFYANQFFQESMAHSETPAPGNIPGGRSNAASWTDKSGNLSELNIKDREMREQILSHKLYSLLRALKQAKATSSQKFSLNRKSRPQVNDAYLKAMRTIR